jgi:hypothetical protein
LPVYKHTPLCLLSAGNHDIVADHSIEAQIAYSDLNSRWVFPNRHFNYEVWEGHKQL